MPCVGAILVVLFEFSEAVGVAQIDPTNSDRGRALREAETRAVGHAEDEQPLAFVARADFRRREKSDLALETESSQVAPDALGATAREHAGDVLDEHPPRAGLDDDPSGRAPQVAGVVAPEPLSGDRVRLARDSANDAIHEAAIASAREGSHIRPHRSRSQEARFHCRDQSSDGRGFPLHQHDCSSRRDCQLDAEIEPSASGAEADGVDGSEDGRVGM